MSIRSTDDLPTPWQDKLKDHCQKAGIEMPVFQVFSDRRGCRTAWSARAKLPGLVSVSARYWYDGNYIHNAMEDAAEVALQELRVVESPKSARVRAYTTTSHGSFYGPN